MVYYRKGTLRTNSEDSNRRTTETSESKETLATTYMLVTEHPLKLGGPSGTLKEGLANRAILFKHNAAAICYNTLF